MRLKAARGKQEKLIKFSSIPWVLYNRYSIWILWKKKKESFAVKKYWAQSKGPSNEGSSHLYSAHSTGLSGYNLFIYTTTPYIFSSILQFIASLSLLLDEGTCDEGFLS